MCLNPCESLWDSEPEEQSLDREDCVDDKGVLEKFWVDGVSPHGLDGEVGLNFDLIRFGTDEGDEGDESAVARDRADDGKVLVHDHHDRPEDGDQDDDPDGEELLHQPSKEIERRDRFKRIFSHHEG